MREACMSSVRYHSPIQVMSQPIIFSDFYIWLNSLVWMWPGLWGGASPRAEGGHRTQEGRGD